MQPIRGFRLLQNANITDQALLETRLTSLVLGRPPGLKADDCYPEIRSHFFNDDQYSSPCFSDFLQESTRLNHLLVRALHRLYNSLGNPTDVQFVLQMDNQLASWRRNVPHALKASGHLTQLSETSETGALQSKVLTIR